MWQAGSETNSAVYVVCNVNMQCIVAYGVYSYWI